jgi:integrase
LRWRARPCMRNKNLQFAADNRMELFKTDSSFEIRGVPYPNVPFLLDKEFEEVQQVNGFLEHTALYGAAQSHKSWLRYAEALKEYFAFLEVNSIDWKKDWATSLPLLAAWRKMMLDNDCKKTYINQQIGIVSRLFRWCVSKEIIVKNPLDALSTEVNGPQAPRQGFLMHTQKIGDKRTRGGLKLSEYKEPIKFLHMDDVPKFIPHLTSHRDRLVALLMVETGMRRMEALHLNRVCLERTTPYNANTMRLTLDAKITPTKNGKTRWVLISKPLIYELNKYSAATNPAASGTCKNFYDPLFKNKDGKQLTLNYLNSAFKAASKVSGIEVHPHMLRHTFGTYELVTQKKAGMSEGAALLWVKERMGHASITTTERYLHIISDEGGAILEKYNLYIDELLNGDPDGEA